MSRLTGPKIPGTHCGEFILSPFPHSAQSLCLKPHALQESCTCDTEFQELALMS